MRLLLVVSLVACTPAAGAPAPAQAASCTDGDPYDVAALKAELTFFASPKLDGRASGTAGDTATIAHIADRFRCLGLKPGVDGAYEQKFSADGDDTANVVAYLPGTDAKVGSEIVVVGAHHDHLGNGFLGANDNGSGTVALLAIAQAVAQKGGAHRTIAFVAFSGEEKGLLGSSYFVAHPPKELPLDRVVEYINIDMVGSYASKNAVYAFGTFPKLAATTALATLGKQHRGLNVGLGGHSVRGDQLDFCKAGIPYVFFWTPDARCYHEKCDTVEKIDFKHMPDIVKLAGELTLQLGDSSDDLAAARTKRGCGTR